MLGMAGVARSANLLTNGSFEDGTSAWSIINWNGASTSITNENKFDGNSSVKTVHTKYTGTYGGSWTSIGQNISKLLQPDTNYLLSIYYSTTSQDGFSFRICDPSQVMHSTTIVGVDPVADGKWHQVSQLFSFSASALSNEPIFTFYYDYNVHAGSTIYLDKISIEPATIGCSDIAVKPHTFTTGTPAKAAEVNTDFDTLYQQLNTLNCQVQSLKTIVCQDHPTADICK